MTRTTQTFLRASDVDEGYVELVSSGYPDGLIRGINPF
jgi:hypothetical protein